MFVLCCCCTQCSMCSRCPCWVGSCQETKVVIVFPNLISSDSSAPNPCWTRLQKSRLIIQTKPKQNPRNAKSPTGKQLNNKLVFLVVSVVDITYLFLGLCGEEWGKLYTVTWKQFKFSQKKWDEPREKAMWIQSAGAWWKDVDRWRWKLFKCSHMTTKHVSSKRLCAEFTYELSHDYLCPSG